MLSAAGCGMPIGYSAILLPQLKNTNDSLHIDDTMGSWIGNLIYLNNTQIFILVPPFKS